MINSFFTKVILNYCLYFWGEFFVIKKNCHAMTKTLNLQNVGEKFKYSHLQHKQMAYIT